MDRHPCTPPLGLFRGETPMAYWFGATEALAELICTSVVFRDFAGAADIVLDLMGITTDHTRRARLFGLASRLYAMAEAEGLGSQPATDRWVHGG